MIMRQKNYGQSLVEFALTFQWQSFYSWDLWMSEE